MNNSSASGVKTNTSVNPAVPVQAPLSQLSSIQPESKPSQQNFLKIVVIALVGLVLTMGAGMIYLFQKQTTSQPAISNTIPTSMSSLPSTTRIDETVNWETYSKDGYQIKYPSDWSIEPITNGFSVNKGKYEINFTTSSLDFGPGICIFSDSPNFDNPYTDNPILAGSKCPENYIEIEGLGFTFRRVESPQTTLEGELTGRWGIYVKDKEGNFVTVPPVQYGIPVPNYDPSEIILMDQILSTFKFMSSLDELFQTIKDITSPMAWSQSQADTYTTSTGRIIQGESVKTNIPDKSQDKLAPLLVTNSLLITYGWTVMQNEAAGGVDSDQFAFQQTFGTVTKILAVKNNKNTGEYTVFIGNL